MTNNQQPCSDFQREALYLRSLIESPGTGAHLVDESARVEPSDFANESHRKIASVIYEFADSSARPYRADVELQLSEPHRTNFTRIMQSNELQPPPKLALELRELAKRRRAYEHTMRIAAAYVAGDVDKASALLDELQVGTQHARPAEFMMAAETIEYARDHAKGKRGNLRTGFHMLDEAIGQLRPQTFTIIGGYEGTGKSSLMLAIAISLAQRGVRVGIISLEDPASVWGPRVASHLSDLNPSDFEGGRGEYFDKNVASAITIAKQLGIYFSFQEDRPLNSTLGAMRHMAVKNRCEVIMVDYVQCFADDHTDERLVVTNAARKIKGQGQRLGVATILGSQLSDPESGKAFKEPHTRQLAHARALGNMAENVILMWKNGDGEEAKTFLKLSKGKWTKKRPRCEVVRNERTGCIEELRHAG